MKPWLISFMTATEKAILETLIQLDEAVKSMKTANPKPNLLPIFAHLDELTAQLPKNSDPDLLHYLHRKSYEKAKLLLEEQSRAAGQKNG